MNLGSATMSGAKETKRFSFSGTASEYFGIWIVNLLLSIITLGIYTAWAKVRRLRYFYGNTWLDGHNFEYHARPMQILIGRIIVFVFLVAMNVLANFFPLYALLAFIPYIIIFPWLINKSIQFNARVTSYRNVRFSFSGDYLRALWVFILLPLSAFLVAGILVAALVEWESVELATGQSQWIPKENDVPLLLTLFGIAAAVQLALAPYVSKLSSEYIGNRTKFGGAEFATTAQLKMLYKNLFVSALPVLIPAILVGLMLLATLGGGISDFGASIMGGFAGLLIFAAYVGFFLAALAYLTGVRNIAYNGTILDGKHQLMSNLSRPRYVWIIVSNFFLIMITIGLMRPWAACRTWNYLAENTAIEVDGSLDGFITEQEGKGSVVAAEYMDIEGIDFGL